MTFKADAAQSFTNNFRHKTPMAMDYLFEEFCSEAYWQAFAERVGPHLGDLQALFTVPWRAGFSLEYPDFARSLCCEALRQAAPIKHWLLERLPSTRRTATALEIIERFAFGFKFEQVVATLHEDCFREGFFPTSVRLDHSRSRFEFYEGPELFAVICPVEFCPTFTDLDSLRADAVIKTWGNTPVDQKSALRMLAEWPSAQILQTVSLPDRFHRTVTPPTLEGWVRVASALLKRAKRDSTSADAAQALTAAVMGAPSFKALKMAMQRHAETGVYPVVVESQPPGDSVHFELYPTCAAGLPRFVALAVQALTGVPGDWKFEGGSYSTEFALEFRFHPAADPADDATDRTVTLRTLPLADACETSRVACNRLATMTGDDERLMGLMQLFRIGQPVAERISDMDRLNDQSVLYQDGLGLRVMVQGVMPTGRWSESGDLRRGNIVYAFASDPSDDLYDGDYLGETAKLYVERRDEHGNLLRRTSGVSLDEGGLIYWAEENAWVLTTGPVFNRPLGVIRGLDDRGVSAMFSILRGNRGSAATEFIADLTFQNGDFHVELAELIREEGMV